MSRIFLFFFLVGAPAFAALAPDSLAGKVYHNSGGIASTRAKWETIVIFGADGRYRFLKFARGSFVEQPAISLIAPPNDGTYAYSHGESVATINLQDPTGSLYDVDTGARLTTQTITLTFSENDRGEWDEGRGHGPFYLTDTTTAHTKQLINVSLRGNVGGGRTAIAGFVVPGPSTPSALVQNSVDLLIRVVGPSLSLFNVATPWADPDFSIGTSPFGVGVSSSDAHYANWAQTPDSAAAIQKISDYVGAFPLLPNSKDAVSVVRVTPGAYTLLCSAAAGDVGGEVLIEVYTLP
jgi:hypothetical protein